MTKISPMIIGGGVLLVVGIIVAVVLLSMNSSKTKKYICSQDSKGTPGCVENPNGFYDSIDVCSQNCRIGGNSGTKYSCNTSTKKCVVDPNGTATNEALCNISCGL